jgi:hypothetical protein
MPEEIEVPIEQLQEDLHEAAEGHGHEGPSWIIKVALSSAIIAVMAAVAALLAGHYANDAMLEQMKATDKWAEFQAKSIKRNVLITKMETLAAMAKEKNEEDVARLETYRKDQEKVQEEATDLEKESAAHMTVHSTLARSVTFFQIAIALAAIAALTRKKQMWLFSLVISVGGTFFFVLGVLPKHWPLGQ